METAALALSTATVTIADDPAGRRFVPAVLRAHVTNIGTINDQFNVDVIDLPPSWYTRSVPGMRMRPGIDGTIDITFSPPHTSDALAGPTPFKVRVTPQEQPDRYVEYGATLQIAPFIDTSMALVEATQQTDGDAVFRLRLRNAGNLPLDYALSALPSDDPAQALAIAFVASGRAEPTTVITVPPGQEVTPELRVAAPPINGIGRRPGPYPFSVQATALPIAAYPELKPPPLTAAGTLVLLPPAPVQVSAPARVELVDVLVREATAIVKVVNPSRRMIGVLLEAKAPTTDYELAFEHDRLVLEPESETEVKLFVRRTPLAPLATSPLKQPFQISVRQVDIPDSVLPADPDPSLLPAPIAAPGSVQVTLPPPIEVTIQPPGLTVELSPRRRAGGVGKFKVAVRNQGTQRVRVNLAATDPDHELECMFGPQPPGWRRFFGRAKQYAAYEADSAIQRRMGARATQLANVAGAPRVSDLAEAVDDGPDLSRAGGYLVTLDPGNRVEVPLQVNPSRPRLVGASQRYPFSVATAVGDQELTGLRQEGEFEHRPLPWLLIALLLILLLAPLAIIIPAKLGCDRGSLEFGPWCVPGAAPVPAPVAVRQTGGPDGRTRIALRDGVQLQPVAEAPASQLPGQFAKLAVPSPDRERVVYVTAKDSGLNGAALLIADKSGQPNQGPPLERLWPAKPVWCQTKPGDPGKLALVTATQAGGGKSGLELRIIDWTDQQLQAKKVLDGATANGFTPSIFYGSHETPLLWWDNCNAVKYTGPDGKRWLVDTRGTGSVSEIRTFNLPDAPAVSAQSKPTSSCELGLFSQNDPQWAQTPLGVASGGVPAPAAAAGASGPAAPTIGANGCTLGAVAAVFGYYGQRLTPGQVIGCAELGGATAIPWQRTAEKCAADKVKFGGWKEDPTLADIAAVVQTRQPAIVGLAGGPSGSHYVVVVAGNGSTGGDFRILDPWDGSSYKRLSDYLDTGTYRLKWLVRYEGTPPSCAVPAAAASAPVVFQGVSDGGSSKEPVTITYSVPSGGEFRFTHPSGQRFDQEGFHSVGVALADGTYRSLNFFVDRTPPQTTAEWKQDAGKLSGVLTLTSKDGITPVAVTRYMLDEDKKEIDYLGNTNGQGTLLTRGVPLTFRSIGDHVATVFSIDAAGNVEQARRVPFTIKLEKLPSMQVAPPQVNMLQTKSEDKVTVTVLDSPGELTWKVVTDDKVKPWLTVTPAEHTYKPGDPPKQVDIKINRGAMPAGPFTTRIEFRTVVGGTQISGDAEIAGEVPGPPPTPTPSPAEVAGLATRAAQSTVAAQKPGGGAGEGDPEPVIEPGKLTILGPGMPPSKTADTVALEGQVTVREKANAPMQWYVREAPAWLELSLGNQVLFDPTKPADQQPRPSVARNSKATITVRPVWGADLAAAPRQSRIVIRPTTNRYDTIILVRVSDDNRTVTLEAQPPQKLAGG
ncbi:MAG: hypothetical protein IT340_02890 [Chloroflexi bacterium]|nr:hypothetical protein [Chloroflexota bacterium]